VALSRSPHPTPITITTTTTTTTIKQSHPGPSSGDFSTGIQLPLDSPYDSPLYTFDFFALVDFGSCCCLVTDGLMIRTLTIIYQHVFDSGLI
jgi:hypothetical protein